MAKNAASGNAADLIKQVIAELDAQIGELNGQRAQLANMVSGVAASPAGRRRGRPPAAVKAGKAGKVGKVGKVASTASEAPAKKRKVSGATKAKLKLAAKARWARYRAEQKGA